jgi:hypothetical protein
MTLNDLLNESFNGSYNESFNGSYNESFNGSFSHHWTDEFGANLKIFFLVLEVLEWIIQLVALIGMYVGIEIGHPGK